MFIAKMVKTKLKKQGFTDKLIRLPDEVWSSLESDADRCRRSVTKQIEAILVAYFQLESVELDKNRLNFARKAEKAITNGSTDADNARIIGKPIAPPLEAVQTKKRRKTG